MTNRKIVHQVTKRYMQKNARRTLISFVGIVLMVTLMTCVFVGKDTALGHLTHIAEANNGKWHIAFYDIDREQLKQIRQTSFIKETAVSENQCYTDFTKSGSQTHPYLNIRRYSGKAFDWMNIHVTEGKLPETESEIVISAAALEDGADISIGDQIEVNCFRRYIENFGDANTVFPFLQFAIESGETKEAPAGFSFFPEGDPFNLTHRETHEATGFHRTYRVTGFIEAPSYENRAAAAYTAIAWMDESSISADTFNCSAILDTDRLPSNVHSVLKEQLGTDQIEINNAVLAFSGDSSDNTINELVLMAQIFFTLLILLVSVILIYNVFNLSYDERCRYLGMLSSVGATARQKRSSVYYEAMSLLLPALPIGFILGLGVVMGGVSLLSPLAAKLLGLGSELSAVPVRPVLRLSSVLLALGFSTATVLLSSLLPARRISKVGPIESIRGNTDKTKGRRKLNEILISRFGAEGMLASGFAANQRKKTRGIVRALAVFLVILTVTAYGAQTVSQMASYKLVDSVTYAVKDAGEHEYMLMSTETTEIAVEDIIRELSETEGIADIQISYDGTWVGMTETDTYSQEFWETLYEIYSLYYPEGLSRQDFEEQYVVDRSNFVNMISVDPITFQEMLTAVHGEQTVVADDPCIVFQTGEMSTDSQRMWERKASEYRFYEIQNMTDLKIGDELPLTLQRVLNNQLSETSFPLMIAGFGNNESLQKWLAIHDDGLWVITRADTAEKINRIIEPDSHGLDITAYFNADESLPAIQSKLKQLENLDGVYFSKSENYLPKSIPTIINGMIRILMIAFTIISSLICYLNIYDSISGLMIARRQEFAILRSNGMTGNQLLKMCRYELYVLLLRSLLTAIPIAFFLCWGINAVMVGCFGHFTVQFPVGLIVQGNSI